MKFFSALPCLLPLAGAVAILKLGCNGNCDVEYQKCLTDTEGVVGKAVCKVKHAECEAQCVAHALFNTDLLGCHGLKKNTSPAPLLSPLDDDDHCLALCKEGLFICLRDADTTKKRYLCKADYEICTWKCPKVEAEVKENIPATHHESASDEPCPQLCKEELVKCLVDASTPGARIMCEVAFSTCLAHCPEEKGFSARKAIPLDGCQDLCETEYDECIMHSITPEEHQACRLQLYLCLKQCGDSTYLAHLESALDDDCKERRQDDKSVMPHKKFL